MTTKGTEIVTHTTGAHKVLFAALARPLTNRLSERTEYSIKLRVKESSPEGLKLKALVNKVNSKKIVITHKVDGVMEALPKGEYNINFSSDSQPLVVGVDGVVLEGDAIPHFDGRVDSAMANVSFVVIPGKGGNLDQIRLTGVQLLETEITEKTSTGLSEANKAASLAAFKARKN